MALDINTLKLGEIAVIEDLTKGPFEDAFAEGKPKGNALAALGMVAKRREQLAEGKLPDFSWNDAQDLTMDQVQELLGWNEDTAEESDDVDPKESSPVSKTTSTTSKAKVK